MEIFNYEIDGRFHATHTTQFKTEFPTIHAQESVFQEYYLHENAPVEIYKQPKEKDRQSH